MLESSPFRKVSPFRPRLLLVEDHPDTVEFMQDRLVGGGFDVEVARTGDEALMALLAVPPPDVVVMDINLPKIDGDQLVEAMRADLLTRDIPVIFVTADSAERVKHLIDPQTTICLEKPLSSKTLIAAARSLLERRNKPPKQDVS